jgi:hypothetical protein
MAQQQPLYPFISPYDSPQETVARLRELGPHELRRMLDDLDRDDRAALAVFCYQRSELRDFGFIIGDRCDRHTLVEIAGVIGDVIYEISRARGQRTTPGTEWSRFAATG